VFSEYLDMWFEDIDK